MNSYKHSTHLGINSLNCELTLCIRIELYLKFKPFFFFLWKNGVWELIYLFKITLDFMKKKLFFFFKAKILIILEMKTSLDDVSITSVVAAMICGNQ